MMFTCKVVLLYVILWYLLYRIVQSCSAQCRFQLARLNLIKSGEETEVASNVSWTDTKDAQVLFGQDVSSLRLFSPFLSL